MHRSDFQLSLYSNATTFNPTGGILCAIQQDRAFRFKQIWVFVNSGDFGASGTLISKLKFWQGTLPPNFIPYGLNTAQSNMLTCGGVLVSELTAGYVASASNTRTLEWGNNTSAHWTQTVESSFEYAIVRGTGFIMVPKCFDVEIVCDFMTLDIQWQGAQYAPYPAMLACIGSTHPAHMYHDYNFQPL